MQRSQKYLLILFVVIASLLYQYSYFSQEVFAQACPVDTCLNGCTFRGECTRNYVCIEAPDGRGGLMLLHGATECGGGKGQAIMGGIYVPIEVNQFSDGVDPAEGTRIGLVNFISLLLRIFTIVCGLWFMFNIIVGGFMFITSSGDSGTIGKFKDSFYFSLIGLALVAMAYLIAALVGSIFFGNAGFIIRPVLYSATQL